MHVTVFDQFGAWRRDFSDVRKVSYNEYGVCQIERPGMDLDINPRVWGFIEKHHEQATPPIAAAVQREVRTDGSFLIPHTAGDPRRLPDALSVRHAMQIQCACDALRCAVRDVHGQRCHLGVAHVEDGSESCVFEPDSYSLQWRWGIYNHHQACPRHPSKYNVHPMRDPAVDGFDGTPHVETPPVGPDDTQPIVTDNDHPDTASAGPLQPGRQGADDTQQMR